MYTLSRTQYIMMLSRTQYIMHNVYMLIVRNQMNLVRIPRRDHMYLAYCILCSRRDHDMRSRTPILMLHRSRS